MIDLRPPLRMPGHVAYDAGMQDNQPRRRNSYRFPGYDYAQPGTVFVTLCTTDRQHLFGSVDEGRVHLSPAGVAVDEAWHRIPTYVQGIALDVFVVMPDHVHGILHSGTRNGVSEPARVGDAIRWLKSVVVEAYRVGVRDAAWPPYDRHLWQRGYYDRITRTEMELIATRRYIEGNPGRWWERNNS